MGSPRRRRAGASVRTSPGSGASSDKKSSNHALHQSPASGGIHPTNKSLHADRTTSSTPDAMAVQHEPEGMNSSPSPPVKKSSSRAAGQRPPNERGTSNSTMESPVSRSKGGKSSVRPVNLLSSSPTTATTVSQSTSSSSPLPPYNTLYQHPQQHILSSPASLGRHHGASAAISSPSNAYGSQSAPEPDGTLDGAVEDEDENPCTPVNAVFNVSTEPPSTSISTTPSSALLQRQLPTSTSPAASRDHALASALHADTGDAAALVTAAQLTRTRNPAYPYDPALAPAVLEPTSDEVHAARHRAKSEALLTRNIAKARESLLSTQDESDNNIHAAGDISSVSNPEAMVTPRLHSSSMFGGSAYHSPSNITEDSTTPHASSSDRGPPSSPTPFSGKAYAAAVMEKANTLGVMHNRVRASTISAIGSGRPEASNTDSPPSNSSYVRARMASGTPSGGAGLLGLLPVSSPVARTKRSSKQVPRPLSMNLDEYSPSSSFGLAQSSSYTTATTFGIWNRTDQHRSEGDSSRSAGSGTQSDSLSPSGSSGSLGGNITSSFLLRPTPESSFDGGNSSNSSKEFNQDEIRRRILLTRAKSNTISSPEVPKIGLQLATSEDFEIPLYDSGILKPSATRPSNASRPAPWQSRPVSPSPLASGWIVGSSVSNAGAGADYLSSQRINVGSPKLGPAFDPSRPSHSATSSEYNSTRLSYDELQHETFLAIHASHVGNTQQLSKPVSGPSECELCGVKASLLTILQPCGHKACSSCTSSGLNQVSTSPPRPHICAACQTPVEGISLPSRDRSHSTASAASWTSTSLSYGDSASTGSLTSPENFAARFRNDLPATPSESPLISASGAPIRLLASDGTSFDPSHHAAHFNVQSIEKAVKELQLDTKSGASRASGIVEAELLEASSEQFSRDTFCVVRVDNIPWTVRHSDIAEWVPADLAILPPDDLVAQAVHIPIDVSNGKTSNACFIECRTRKAAMRLIRNRNNTRLCGRPVSLIHSSYQELLSEVFPARVSASSTTPSGRPGSSCRYFTSKQLESLIALSKGGALQLKDACKPIEYMTSIVGLVPQTLSVDQASMLLDGVKRILGHSISKATAAADVRFAIDRLLSSIGRCAAFTVSQRLELIEYARVSLGTSPVHLETSKPMARSASLPAGSREVATHHSPAAGTIMSSTGSTSTHDYSVPPPMSPPAMLQQGMPPFHMMSPIGQLSPLPVHTPATPQVPPHLWGLGFPHHHLPASFHQQPQPSMDPTEYRRALTSENAAAHMPGLLGSPFASPPALSQPISSLESLKQRFAGDTNDFDALVQAVAQAISRQPPAPALHQYTSPPLPVAHLPYPQHQHVSQQQQQQQHQQQQHTQMFYQSNHLDFHHGQFHH